MKVDIPVGLQLLFGTSVLCCCCMRCVVSCGSTLFHGLYSSLELCCEGPRFASIQENGCDKGAHQTYDGTERNIPVIPNWFRPCQCCCCLCCTGEYLGLGTLNIKTEPRYLKLVAVSSFCLFILISVLMPLVLFVISLVF